MYSVPILLSCRFGPLVKHWTMRYEAKHSYSKKLIQNIGNYKNVSYTLAKRHQLLHCYYHHAGDVFGQDRLEVGPGNLIKIRPQHSLSLNLIFYLGDVVAIESRPPELWQQDS